VADWHTGRWSLYAPVYDAIARATRDARRRSFGLLDLIPEERLLIVGCGTGLDFEFVPPGVAVEASDASAAMTRRAGRRAAQLLPAAQVRVMDATRLDYPDAAFDAAVLHLILAVLPDPAPCVREVARVLRPGGRVAVLDKFVPGDCRPGRTRRALNLITRAAATSITVCLEELLEGEPFTIERQEPAMLRGQFRIALLRRT
jgi:phosphatidylethanolamine/phosphatidyl-N-methylethanolamine N-methyltransferase